MTQSRSPFDFLAARFPGVDQSNSWATTIELRAKLSAATSRSGSSAELGFSFAALHPV